MGRRPAGGNHPVCATRGRLRSHCEASQRPLSSPCEGSMKPYVICHMVASIDGRTLTSRWRPENAERRRLFEGLHDRLGVDAWLVGRVTGQEYAKRDAYSPQTGQRYPREAWFARRDAAVYGIVLDARGKIAWGRGDIGGDSIGTVLTQQAGDAPL